MADTYDSKAEDSAAKAYAAAAEAAGVSAVIPETSEVPEPEIPNPEIPEEATGAIEFPAKSKRAPKPSAAKDSAPEPATESEPAAPTAVLTAAAAEPKVIPARAVKPAKVKTVKVKAAAPKLAVKRAPAKPALTAKPTAKAVALSKPQPKSKPETVKPKTIKTAPKSAKASAPAAPKFPFIAQLKEFPMDVSTTIKDAVDGAQAKAKEALSKTSAAAGEYTDFAKGNVEALVESGKILAVGLQEIGNQAVAESKSAFETLVADAKSLSSVKSPIDFFKLQTELLRRNIDHAVAYGSKTSESMIKLTSDAIAPLSGRVTLAIEKVKKAA